jgi:hypothetical protein
MKPLVWAAGIAAVFYGLLAHFTNSLIGLVALAILAPLVYYVSLKVHPNTNCRHCKGTARHRGMLFTYAHRPCVECAGTGRHVRWGYRTFFADGKAAHAAEVQAREKAKTDLRKRH